MLVDLRKRKIRNQWHIVHELAACLDGAKMMSGFHTKSVRVDFNEDDPDDFEAFVSLCGNWYVDKYDICARCRGALVRAAKLLKKESERRGKNLMERYF